MLSNKIVFIAVLVFNGLFLIGCPNPERVGPAPGTRIDHPSQPHAGIRYNGVAIIDKSLQDWSHPKNKFILWDTDESNKNYGLISVDSTNSRRTETGTLEAWAVLQNRTNSPLQIEGRITFFDKDKVSCEAPTAWQKVFLQPNSLEKYGDFSTKTQEVSYYYIEIREGR
jgi:hypothetical protein